MSKDALDQLSKALGLICGSPVTRADFSAIAGDLKRAANRKLPLTAVPCAFGSGQVLGHWLFQVSQSTLVGSRCLIWGVAGRKRTPTRGNDHGLLSDLLPAAQFKLAAAAAATLKVVPFRVVLVQLVHQISREVSNISIFTMLSWSRFVVS